MLLRGVALALAGSLLAAPSWAADIVRPVVVRPVPVVAVKASPFDGFYLGGAAGYAWAERKGCETVGSFPAPRSCRSSQAFDYKQKGWTAGGQVGLNHVLGGSGLMVGAEVNAALTGITGNLLKFDGVGDWQWLANADVKVGWTAGNWMVYAKGGVALGGFHYASAICTFDSVHQGWNFGAAAEVATKGNNTLFIDWSRSQFDGKDAACSFTYSGSTVPVAVYTKPTVDVVRVGFNHYFN
jgi:outer membrane immunogenic protein